MSGGEFVNLPDAVQRLPAAEQPEASPSDAPQSDPAPAPERNPKLEPFSDADLLAEITARRLKEQAAAECDDSELISELRDRGIYTCDGESCSDDFDDEARGFHPAEVQATYQALSGATPEPIRQIVLQLAGRIV